MSFVPPNIQSRLGSITRDELDSLDFGAVRVSDDGTIQMYNRYEANLAGLEPSAVEGKNFFTQVAPCTNNRLCFGKFKEGVSSGNLNAEMPYTFTYKLKPTNVQIHLYRDPASSSNWVFVKA